MVSAATPKWWGSRRHRGAYVCLACNCWRTLARIWSTLATGVIRSKDDAATWVLARLPEQHRNVLCRARAIYLGEEEERWHDVAAQVRTHAEYVVREIELLVANKSP
ncbi:MAG: DUF4111 domain-containing protein [Chloroflexi bacterium]|nr:DUF4111 domain-containing protein [Chloroflexota bacterium]